MAVATEGKHAGEFVVTDEGEDSRDTITVLSGQVLQAGHVVGRVSTGAGRVSIPTVVGTGNGTVSLVTAGADVEVGNYVLTCTAAVAHGGVWSLVSPSGLVLPVLTMTPGAGGATAYVSSHLRFTITDGSTDFAAGDVFTFVVSTTAPTVIGGTGTGTVSAISAGPLAQTGNYRLINREAITNGGRFELIAPDGQSLGDNFLMTAGSGTATAFTTPHLNFTLTDATDFILGNYFDIAVFNQLGGGKIVEWDPTAADGRHEVAGIAWDNYDATSADLRGVIEVRRAVVNGEELVWKSTLSTAQQAAGKAALTAMGVVVR